jgi:quercetin dioxygenase-like cupin family protein
MPSPGTGPSRASWKRLTTTSVKARASQRLASEVQRLWQLSCRARIAREQGLAAAEFDEAIALAASDVIAAHRAKTRRRLPARIGARALALSTLLDEALFDQEPDATRVNVMHPLHAGPQMGLSRWELAPGQPPYRYRLAARELVLVLDGRPTLHSRQGRRELAEGELVGLEPGRDGACQLVNGTRENVRFLAFSASPPDSPA